MLRHARTVCSRHSDNGGYVCDACGRPFGTGRHLERHKRTVRCDPDQPPSPKRSRTIPTKDVLVEDPVEPPEGNDVLSDDLQEVVRQHWASIRTSVARGPVQSRYIYRLTTLDTPALDERLRRVFDEQTYSFKINMSYGFVLETSELNAIDTFTHRSTAAVVIWKSPASLQMRKTLKRFSNVSDLPTFCSGLSLSDRTLLGSRSS